MQTDTNASVSIGGTQFKVWEWEGTKSITKLSAYPLEYHPNLRKLKQELMARGKLFESLSGYHYKDYSGIAIGQGPWGPIKYNVSDALTSYWQDSETVLSDLTSVISQYTTLNFLLPSQILVHTHPLLKSLASTYFQVY